MNTRFVLFLIIVAILVSALVVWELNREHPWNSDVFFGQLDSSTVVSQRPVVKDA